MQVHGLPCFLLHRIGNNSSRDQSTGLGYLIVGKEMKQLGFCIISSVDCALLLLCWELATCTQTSTGRALKKLHPDSMIKVGDGRVHGSSLGTHQFAPPFHCSPHLEYHSFSWACSQVLLLVCGVPLSQD